MREVIGVVPGHHAIEGHAVATLHHAVRKNQPSPYGHDDIEGTFDWISSLGSLFRSECAPVCLLCEYQARERRKRISKLTA